MNSGNLDELLGAAEMLQRALGGERGSEYARWLEGSVGRLRLSVRDVVDALADFEGPLATTNYDGLLEQATGREAVTWRQPVDVERVLRGSKKAILHLHGYWKEPESVILSIKDYDRILQAERAQALQKALGALRTIVFVGCGGEGLSDPNFGPMLDWVLRLFHDSRFHHYLLARSHEAAILEKEYSQTGKLKVVRYGNDFRDLGPFLREVIPGRNPPAAGLAGDVASTAVNPPEASTRLPVRPTRCIGRDEAIKSLIFTLLQDRVPPTPVLGPAGIGKSTMTLGALHDEQVAKRFGTRRFFVRCDASNDAEALLTQIALEVQLPPGPSLQERLFGELDRASTLLVLDNLETPWEQDSQPVEELLVRLAALPRLALIVSLRGKARPAGPEWRDPPFELEPLGREDSRRVFLAIAGQKFLKDPRIEDFLTALEGVPLAIELLAYVCHAEPDLEGAWTLWEQKRTEILKRKGSAKGKQASPRQESLEASYELSLDSPRMTKQALRLLKLLGCLPLGVAHGDLRRLPTVMEAVQAAMTLRQMGLAFDEAGRLRMLAPLREYANRRHRPSAGDRDLIINHYLRLAIGECECIGSAESGDATRRLSAEVGNVESVLELGLQRTDPRPAIAVALKWEKFIVFSGLGTTRPLKRALDAIREIKDVKSEAQCFYGLGKIASSRAQAHHAKDYFLRAIVLYRRSKNLQGQANCIYRLGDVALYRSHLDEAVEQYKQAIELYRKTQDPQGQANCTFSLGEVALHRSQLDEAATQFKEALRLYQQLKDLMGQANCIQGLGDVAIRHSQLDEAASQYKQALELYRLTEARPSQANCIYGLGDVALKRSQLDEAASQYKQALEIYRQTQDPQGHANCIFSLGEVSLGRSRLDEAASQLKEALILYHQLEDLIGQANATLDLGEIARKRFQLDEAAAQFQKALEIYRHAQDLHGQANCILSFGEVALHRSLLSEAATQFRQALEIYQQIQSPRGKASCLLRLGEVDLCGSHLDEAAAQFNAACELYRQAQDRGGVAECIENLGEIALRRSQPGQAQKLLLEALVQFERLPDLLSIGRIHRSLARMASDVVTRKRHIDLAVAAWSQLGNRVLIDEILKEFGEASGDPTGRS